MEKEDRRKKTNNNLKQTNKQTHKQTNIHINLVSTFPRPYPGRCRAVSGWLVRRTTCRDALSWPVSGSQRLVRCTTCRDPLSWPVSGSQRLVGSAYHLQGPPILAGVGQSAAGWFGVPPAGTPYPGRCRAVSGWFGVPPAGTPYPGRCRAVSGWLVRRTTCRDPLSWPVSGSQRLVRRTTCRDPLSWPVSGSQRLVGSAYHLQGPPILAGVGQSAAGWFGVPPAGTPYPGRCRAVSGWLVRCTTCRDPLSWPVSGSQRLVGSVYHLQGRPILAGVGQSAAGSAYHLQGPPILAGVGQSAAGSAYHLQGPPILAGVGQSAAGWFGVPPAGIPYPGRCRAVSGWLVRRTTCRDPLSWPVSGSQRLVRRTTCRDPLSWPVSGSQRLVGSAYHLQGPPILAGVGQSAAGWFGVPPAGIPYPGRCRAVSGWLVRCTTCRDPLSWPVSGSQRLVRRTTCRDPLSWPVSGSQRLVGSAYHLQGPPILAGVGQSAAGWFGVPPAGTPYPGRCRAVSGWLVRCTTCRDPLSWPVSGSQRLVGSAYHLQGPPILAGVGQSAAGSAYHLQGPPILAGVGQSAAGWFGVPPAGIPYPGRCRAVSGWLVRRTTCRDPLSWPVSGSQRLVGSAYHLQGSPILAGVGQSAAGWFGVPPAGTPYPGRCRAVSGWLVRCTTCRDPLSWPVSGSQRLVGSAYHLQGPPILAGVGQSAAGWFGVPPAGTPYPGRCRAVSGWLVRCTTCRDPLSWPVSGSQRLVGSAYHLPGPPILAGVGQSAAGWFGVPPAGTPYPGRCRAVSGWLVRCTTCRDPLSWPVSGSQRLVGSAYHLQGSPILAGVGQSVAGWFGVPPAGTPYPGRCRAVSGWFGVPPAGIPYPGRCRAVSGWFGIPPAGTSGVKYCN